MNPEKTEQLKQQLEAEQTRLEALIARTAKHLYRRDEPYSADFAEQANEVSNNEVVEQLDEDAEAKLIDIQRALGRIENGSYGICTACENNIQEDRLELLPETANCINCAK